MKLNVGVIFGGKSLEHEMSIISAIQAMDNIDTEKYDITPIYITKDREWYTGGSLRYIDTYKDLSLRKRYTNKVNLINKDMQEVIFILLLLVKIRFLLNRYLNQMEFLLLNLFGLVKGFIVIKRESYLNKQMNYLIL